MKKILIILLILNLGLAQQSISGIPYSIKNNFKQTSEKIVLPDLDIDQLLLEDRNALPATPFRYGYIFETNISLDNSGEWIQLNNGDRIWRLSIESQGAFAISIEYNQFFLPENSTFFISNNDGSMIKGGYTNNNNQPDMLFASPLIKGDVMYLEYYEPANQYGHGIINISSVIHDYKDILNFSNTRNSRSCGDNVVCNSANGYEDQINATSWLDMGGYICSGAMINNTNFDLTPYYWTAWHCVEGDNPSTFRFYFNYETSSCSGSWANTGSYEYGGTLLSDSNGMDPDYALILITDNTISNNIFYSGWDKSTSNPTISCGVHHPNGDPKKINFDNDTAYSSGAINWQGQGSSPAGSHWRVYWDDGGTYGGSSGSPVFNNEGLLVGQLSGGSGNCYSGDTEDYYGKFSRSFNDVSQWLDPINSGLMQIEGTYDGTNNTDYDNDGVTQSEDWDDNDPYVCSDLDNDSCDDCTTGNFNLNDDGWDYDGDGLCDAGDIDDDNDGSIDTEDSNDNNPYICSDNDLDTCDDCSSGSYNTNNDGLDDDNNGICNAGEFITGDASMDGVINILDVVVVVSHIMGVDILSDSAQEAADINQDNNINIIDVVTIVNIILG